MPNHPESSSPQESSAVRFLETNPLGSKKKQSEAKPGQLYLLLALLAVLIWVLFHFPTGSFRKPSHVPSAVSPVPPYPVGVQKAIEPARVKQSQESASLRSSPFSMEDRGSVAPAPAPALPVLSGILTEPSGQGGQAYAVINGTVVKKGDRVADNLVKEIAAETVTLQKEDGEVFDLRLEPSKTSESE